MQTTLQIFEYENGHNVRTTTIDREIWFYAVDVCEILDIKNPSDAISKLDNDEKATLANSEGQHGMGAQSYNIINESGLYHLIFTSRKEEAQKFRKWVTSEVLPSIRKKGGYLLPGQTATPLFVRRFNDNWDRVEHGYFSIISELYIRVHGRLEQLGYTMPDKSTKGQEMRPDISVGKKFPKWLENKYPQHKDRYKMYKHKLPKIEVDARQYELELLPLFIQYIDESWLPEESYTYFSARDKKALPYLPRICPQLIQSNDEIKFNKALKKARQPLASNCETNE